MYKEHPQFVGKRFRETLQETNKEAVEFITRALDQWRFAHGLPGDNYITIPVSMQTNIQATSRMDHCVYVEKINGEGIVGREDGNFYKWEDLGTENALINIAEYLDGIITRLLMASSEIIILKHLNAVWGGSEHEQQANITTANDIAKSLSDAGLFQ